MSNADFCVFMFIAFIVALIIGTDNLLNLEGAIASIILAGCQTIYDAWHPIVCEEPMSRKCINLRRGCVFVLVICILSIVFVVAKIVLLKLRRR